ncbi:MAG: RsbRD N-terminal domain-containing protein [Deltaproteobacteria bacterium]|nr:RsbRD N-terminal domain-containing protein [Deltaproteobacteria bacterium]
MKLTQLLTQKKSAIFERWLDMIFSTYPPETSAFLKKEKDRFNNPMAYRIYEGAKGLVNGLVLGATAEEVSGYLDEIIRIKAMQDVAPSQALAFIFFLKTAVREELHPEIQSDAALSAEVVELESQIDGIALLGFDVYQKRREKLCEIRVDEVKRSVSGLLRKAGVNLNNL